MEQLKLHLGCGWRDFGDDWVHIDGGDYEHLDHENITALPYKDKTVDLIYASHVLEYFDRDEVIYVLKEWKRVLKPGGKLRLAVPNFNKMVELYTQGLIDLDDMLGPLYGKMDMGYHEIYHKTTYDKESLFQLLVKESQFSDMERWDWKQVDHGVFDDHSQAYMAPKGDKENGTLISLNLEFTK